MGRSGRSGGEVERLAPTFEERHFLPTASRGNYGASIAGEVVVIARRSTLHPYFRQPICAAGASANPYMRRSPMSRRTRTTTTGVSLFPFLDVLVCTMGSLILLLLVATNRIRAAAVEKARQAALKVEQPPSEPSKIKPIVVPADPKLDPTLEWQTRIKQLTSDRDAMRTQLSQLKNQLAAAQSTITRTKVKAVSAEDRLREIHSEQEQSNAEQTRLQAEIDSLQSDLTEAEQRLAKALERQQTARSKFAFLPFDGRTGTTKRPILIECTQDYIRFLPEDVRLTPADLNGFTTGFNPLLIASRELIHYWKAYDRVHEADNTAAKDVDSFETDLAALNDNERQPYVLLLVRPDGAVAFHIAKTFLSQLKVPNGYELITDDMEIDSSNADPDAKHICQTAVQQVLAEREKVLQVLARNRDQQREQLQLEPSARTFVPKESDESSSSFSPTKPVSKSSNGGIDRDGRPGSIAQTTASGTQPRREGAPTSASPSASKSRAISAEGRSLAAEEPPEEPLPQTQARRYDNDDTKPFPLTRPDKKKPAALSGSDASAPGAKDPELPTSRQPLRSTANKPTSGPANQGNLAQMKRRYLIPRSGIGLEKAITIRISARRVVVGGEYEIPVEAGVRTESVIDRVLVAMDRVQSGWPSAGEGYHWVPTIKYEVLPGGEQVHQRLNSALFDLGLVSTVEFLDADPDAAKSSRETSRSRATTPVGQASSLPSQKRQAGSLPHDSGGAR